MKILIWSQYFRPETFRINDVAATLVEMGHEVTVLTGKPNYPEGNYYDGYGFSGTTQEHWIGLDIVRIPVVNRGQSEFRLALNYLSFVFSGYVFAPRALAQRNFDLIFVYAPSPIFQALPALNMARQRGLPTVLWIQDIWPEVLLSRGYMRNRYLIWLVERVVRFIYNRSTLLLVQSEEFRRSVSRLVTDPFKIEYMPNPAEETAMTTQPTLRACKLAERMAGKFSVTFTGNLGKAQALDTVLEAASRLLSNTQVQIHLIGSGSLSSWLKNEITQRGLNNVVLSDRLPASDMPLILASSDALLVSLSNDVIGKTTVPSKLQSYLAAGRPVIASMDGEGARIVGEAEAGLTCPAEDPGKLAEAILHLHAMNEIERMRLGENGRRYYLNNFELNFLCRRLMGMFAVVLDSTKERME